MDWLWYAWGVAFIVTVGALVPGAIRTLAYRSGEVDHTRTMRIAATFAMVLGVIGLVCLIGLSVAIAVR